MKEDGKVILTEKVDINFVKELAQKRYKTMIKGCVDIERGIVAIGGQYHMETCEMLSIDGSNHTNVWGFNIRFEFDENGEIEFDSLVNIKPNLKNMGRDIKDKNIINKGTEIIKRFINIK